VTFHFSMFSFSIVQEENHLEDATSDCKKKLSKYHYPGLNITFDFAEYDPLANSPEGVVSSGISCV